MRQRHGPTARKGGSGYWLFAFVVLLALCVLLFHECVFGGKILSQADVLFAFPPWSAYMPEGFIPSNALLEDQSEQFAPWLMFSRRMLRAGEIPLWNPYTYCGCPFVGNYQSAVFFPTTWLAALLPLGKSFVAVAVLKILVTGLSTFAFARVLGVSPVGSLFAGIAYGFGGFMICWLQHPHSSAAALLPLLFLTAHGLARHGGVWRAAAFGLALGFSLLAGHPETTAHAALGAGVYFVWRFVGESLRRHETSRRVRYLISRGVGFLIGVAIALSVSSIQLLPFVENFAGSHVRRERSAGSTDLAKFTFPGRKAAKFGAALYAPKVFGAPHRLNWWLRGYNFNELNGGYVGLIALLLAQVAVAMRGRGSVAAPFVLIALGSIGVVLRVPGWYDLVTSLPGLRSAYNQRMVLLLGFSVAVLGGMGLDCLGKIGRGWVALSVGNVVAFVMLVGLVVAEVRDNPAHRATALAGVGTSAAFLGIAIAVFAIGQRRRARPESLGLMCVGLLVVDLLLFGRGYNPSLDPEMFFPETKSARFLRENAGAGRIVCADPHVFPPDTAMAYEIASVRGYDIMEQQAYLDLLACAGEFRTPYHHMQTYAFSRYDSAVADLLGVRYVVSVKPLNHAKLLAVPSGDVRIYENRHALPRVFIPTRIRSFATKHGLLRELKQGNEKLDEVCFVGADARGLTGEQRGEAALGGHRPQRVDVTLSEGAEGLVVLTDGFMPGWRAYAGGARAPVFRAYHALRGALVSRGARRLSFVYDPRSFRYGMVLTLLGVAWSCGVLAFALRPPSP